MKFNGMVILFAALLLTLPAVAPAQEGLCTNGSVAGTWAYAETGTMILPAPTGAIPYASVGKYTLDADGNLSGERTASAGETIVKATIKGTATVNPDCTGTLTLRFYDQLGNSTGAAAKAVVYLNNSTEARLILSSGVYPTVLTTEAKKLFPVKM